MGKKLEGNGMWESSRMVLPEHREALIDDRRSLELKHKKELDDQERDRISLAIQDSINHRQSVTLRLFDPTEDLQVIGVVERVDTHQGRLKMDGEWFYMDDIVSVELSDSELADSF